MNKEIIVRIFPVVLMAVDLCAAIVYFCYGDIRMGLYWLFALGLTACVTF